MEKEEGVLRRPSKLSNIPEDELEPPATRRLCYLETRQALTSPDPATSRTARAGFITQ